MTTASSRRAHSARFPVRRIGGNLCPHVWLALLAALVLAPAAVGDAGGATLTLVEARAIALAENPGLAELQARYESLAEMPAQEAALPDPMLSLGAMNFPWDEFDRQQEPMTQLQVGLSQVFPFPGKRGLREDVALFEAEAASHSVGEMRLDLDRNVAMTWWELYFLDRSLDTVARNQTLLRQFVEVAGAKYEVGSGLQQDVLLAQLELSKLLDHEIGVKAMRERAAIRLNLLMGRPPDLVVALPREAAAAPAPQGTADRLYRRAEQNRPVLAQQRATIQASASRLELAKKDYYPDFRVGVTYGNRDEDDLGRSRQDFLSVALSVNLPLYAGSRQDRAVRQRSRELARSNYALVDQKNLVMASIAEALTDHRRASEQATLYRQGIIPQARQTVQSMMAGYQVDQVDFLNLVRAQVTLFNYELQYWQSFTEANQAIARLQAAVGEENVHE